MADMGAKIVTGEVEVAGIALQDKCVMEPENVDDSIRYTCIKNQSQLVFYVVFVNV